MDTRLTSDATRCEACNWTLYRGQQSPCRVTEEIKDGNNVEHVAFYCSETCYNNPEPNHHHSGPVS